MKIVVTTDGSDRSLKVLPHAGAFVRATRAELLLTRILDPAEDLGQKTGTFPGASLEDVSGRWAAEMRAWGTAAGVEVTPNVTVLDRGENTAKAIARTAREHDAGMIAMASGGAGTLRHALLGSVAMAVVGQSRIPVLVVTDSTTELATPEPYNLVITTDGSESSKDVLIEMAPLLDGSTVHVTLLHIFEPRLGDAGDRFEIPAAEARLREMRPLLPANIDVATKVEPVGDFERVENAIMRVADDVGAEAIALSTHGHSARRHLFAGSTALAVLKKSRLPVILARK
jgi:nucleotide-binding universal stress UspA family protein